MSIREISYYSDYISENFENYLINESENKAHAYPGVGGLVHIGETGGPENTESMQFVCELYDKVKDRLNLALNHRIKDRAFIDQRVKAYHTYNNQQGIDFLSSDYKTILGDEDENGRIVVGPKQENYCGKSRGAQVAPIPEHLKGFHVTLFGPPDNLSLIHI